ncbi:MAG: hypothetical protein A3C02_02650 [Candidatus Andersenbacteria bacterium RIFCSPHIGHO2_02_FULL_45_11]|uniref:Polymerase nucleotidyl transferase domain-containing protein n=1 Tax=Candidatus Andersenbacteria bacterium RIFCSPHIGHO2_12_FULL_45_11 TaxID=1797281 RepID=A0A1G1X5K5_9BACT|nr:MAG: hypothetical protein A3C02_02650 [Candidatus Andersenbacteria bacterium RIFCSPHIGHO2_02_FULL_45_11]OGY35269.1 MAG: hypothetical protein A3D99_01210 [Candidatus Andersenbacteria bacterium RIFCSPHIGHO2_12_FULL_45_11]
MRDSYLTPASPSKGEEPTSNPPPYEGGVRGGSSQLEQSIFDTIRFFDLYEMPVTVTQIWEHLVVSSSGYDHHPSLQEVQHALAFNSWLVERIGSQWGYYFLSGKQHLVRVRLTRHAIAQQKWKIMLRCAPFLAWLPFVRGLAGSGSLAIDNTKDSSDLDVLVITQQGRIWTARLLLLLVSGLLGRRRRYYDRNAPDMVCLNHYVAQGSIPVSTEIQNVAMAMQYACLVPIYGDYAVRKFMQRNAFWIDQHVRMPVHPDVRHAYTIVPSGIARFLKREMESLLSEPLGDYIEEMAEYFQRWMVRRHQDFSRPGRIALSSSELAFHPDTKMPAIVQAFEK